MKHWILACFSGLLLFPPTAQAQKHQLTQVWETDTLLRTPESVLYDAKARLLNVSNIDGVPNEKDRKGSIAKVGFAGKIINARRVT